MATYENDVIVTTHLWCHVVLEFKFTIGNHACCLGQYKKK